MTQINWSSYGPLAATCFLTLGQFQICSHRACWSYRFPRNWLTHAKSMPKLQPIHSWMHHWQFFQTNLEILAWTMGWFRILFLHVTIRYYDLLVFAFPFPFHSGSGTRGVKMGKLLSPFLLGHHYRKSWDFGLKNAWLQPQEAKGMNMVANLPQDLRWIPWVKSCFPIMFPRDQPLSCGSRWRKHRF